MGEGILEWIQVSEGYRRRGLGSFLVKELLWRMQGKVKFATVSGQCDSPSCPERLYRSCGFTGQDVWHVLHKIP
jgi:GNAT superfamily N-acetyltransferase